MFRVITTKLKVNLLLRLRVLISENAYEKNKTNSYT